MPQGMPQVHAHPTELTALRVSNHYIRPLDDFSFRQSGKTQGPARLLGDIRPNRRASQ